MGGKIVLCPNPFRDIGLTLARKTMEILRGDGRDVVMSPVFIDVSENGDLVPLEKSASTASMIVSFGGDGTFLHVAREVQGRDIPLLGVNLGSKGFMASLEPNNLELVRRAAAGEYRKSRRMMLDVELRRAGMVIRADCALNDAVIKSDISCIGLHVTADGVGITNFNGDGVIVSTPTGSTAYSLSAGGPIVEPEAENIIVTPICAHGVGARSFVLSSERTITVTPDRLRGRKSMLSVDGTNAQELNSGDVICLHRSENTIIIAEMGIKNFYDTTREKLTESK